MTPEEIKTKLGNILKPSRYRHSLSVADTAAELARRYGADPHKAYLAGLLHDCAKCYGEDELKSKIRYYGIDLDTQTFNSVQLLHSFVGAYEAKELYGADDAIFDAIYYHTIGKAAMPLLTAIVYLADAIEPLRDYPDAEGIRRMAEVSLEKAIHMYTNATVSYVKSKGGYVHPNAYKVIDYYSQF